MSGRCGLGDLAPVTCRVFPADPVTGSAPTGRQPGCECQEWTEKDLDEEKLTQATNGWAADRDHWFEVVKRWNALADESDSALGIEDFQRYLLEAQAAREAGAPWPEEVAV